MNKSIVRCLAIFGVSAALVATPSVSFAEDPDINRKLSKSVATVETSTGLAPECVEAVEAAQLKTPVNIDVNEVCSFTTKLAISAPEVITVAEAREVTGLTTADKTALVTAAAAGVVRSKHYSQFTTGGTYTRTHNGTFYYDGARAWVGTSYRGYRGTHSCFTNYAVGQTITSVSCTETGTTTRRDLTDRWTVTYEQIPFVPVTYGMSMTASVHANGSAPS